MSRAASLPRDEALARWAAWLLPLAVLLFNLGGAPLFDVDEGAFASATREMLASGNWWSTTLNGVPRFDKPILIYWLQAASVASFGFGEWQVRLPSALAAAAWCGIVGRFALQRLPAGTAPVAAVVAVTSFGVAVIGRAATADALLNLLLAAACLDGWRHLADGRRAPLLRTYAWIGLGLLAKGPIAILVPAAALGLWAATSGRLRTALRSAFDPLGWALLLAIALPWYVAALAIHGQAFIDGFIMKHNVERALSPLHGHRGFVGYAFFATLLLVAPWTAVLFGAAFDIRRDFADPLRRFLWLWFAFVLALFTFVSTKLPHYMLYGATPLFLLAALKARAWAEGPAWQRVLLVAPPLLLLAAVPLLPAGAAALAAGETRPHVAAMLERAAGVADAQRLVPLAIALAAAGVVLAAVLWRRALLAACGVALLLAVAQVALVVPYLGELMQGPTLRAARVAQSRTEPVVLWHYPAPTFSAYLGRVTPMREPRPGELAFTRVGQVPADVPVEVVYREGGVVLVRRLGDAQMISK